MFLWSTQRSDLIIISLSGMTWRNWDRLKPEEQRLQDASRKLPGKSCCKQRVLTPNLVNRSLLIKKIHFWQVPKTFNSTVALQGAFLKRPRDCSSLFSLSQFLHVIPDRLMIIRSDLCVDHKNITGLLQLMAKWYFLLTHYSKIWK